MTEYCPNLSSSDQAESVHLATFGFSLCLWGLVVPAHSSPSCPDKEVFFEPLETTSINYVILLPHLTPSITYLESKVIPRTVWELKWLSLVDTWCKVVHIQAIKKLVHIGDEHGRFLCFWTPCEFQCLWHRFTENLRVCDIVINCTYMYYTFSWCFIPVQQHQHAFSRMRSGAHAHISVSVAETGLETAL